MDDECDLTNRDPNNLNDHLAVSKRTVVLASVVWLAFASPAVHKCFDSVAFRNMLKIT